ncbi:uncharacterized protein VTP21DRAFT_6569 [Calcarisporiella thermophila]|uniref:uncharacterized protein n=1 Tax=Calcarisporiella thermophila TaxID=911321 RepID=UPI0037433B01
MSGPQDADKFPTLLRDLTKKVKELQEHLKPTVDKAQSGEIKTSKGISLLEVKYNLLLQYITNLAFLVLLKLDGKKIEDHPVIDSLAELRVVLEKIKPVEQKLKYQIDKLIRAATVGATETGKSVPTAVAMVSDPLQFKPNPQNLLQSSSNEPNLEDTADAEDAVYRAPKIAPLHYDDSTPISKREREEARARQRASKSRLMRDLVAEYDDRPEEVDATGGVHEGMMAREQQERLREREEYEEANFTRLLLSKKDKKKLGIQRLEDEFEKLEDFSSIAGVHNEDEEKDRKNVLERRKQRRFKDEEIDDEEVEGTVSRPTKRTKSAVGELFDDLVGTSGPRKKSRSNFSKAKREIKKKRKRN